MDSNVNGGKGPSRGPRPFRPKIRQASIIIPKTGQRLNRTFTLGFSPGLTPPHGHGRADEESPLLNVPKDVRKPSDALRLLTKTTWLLYRNAMDFARSKTGKGVLKCSIAYLLGSLATFVPAIAAILGQQDGKHMVATITVYFHPARSQGSMFEAVVLAILAFAYATFIAFTSMGVSIFFGRVVDLVTIGHVIVLVVFCGGGLGFVGWIKQRLGHPLVNISCSLTSLAIITVLTKEGAVQAAEFSADKIVQVLKMIVMGVIATTAVSFLIFPESARIDLWENLISFTDTLSEVLTSTTGCFLVGSEEELRSPRYQAAMDKYKSQLASIDKNLVEAKYEHYIAGTEGEYQLEARLVRCMQRLAQNIGGLKSAATTQFLILAQPGSGISTGGRSGIDSGISGVEHSSLLGAIDEASELEENELTTDPASKDSTKSILSPEDVFAEFIEHLGPSIKSLAYTLREILADLRFGPKSDHVVMIDSHYRSSLEAAIRLYSQSRQDALSKLYDTNEVNKEWSKDVEADFEEIAASCGVFSYALQDFANEMIIYLDILDELKLEIEERPRGRTWNWLKVWRRHRGSTVTEVFGPVNAMDQEAYVLSNAPSVLHPTSPVTRSEPDSQKWTPRYRLWKALAMYRRDDTKFAIKVGAGAALYALPSFLSATRPFYQHFRGEWGLLSYMLVCSMTIGASNTTGYARFLGTCIGAVCAIITWTLSGENPVALAAFGWFMSFWTAYIIVAQGKGPMGRFIMLTYNLSALYAYSLSVKDLDDDNDEGGISPIITEITFHRTAAVLSGCVWGLIITRLIWPISARQKLKDGLSVLWLRMGLVWKRRPMECRLQGRASNAYMDLAEESHLHRFLAQLEKLRESAASEVNLRGPFPDASYKRLLGSTGGMLDALHAMNIMMLKESQMSAGEAAILQSTTAERAQLSLRITHLFQVMASSIKLEYPLNDALPSIESTRDRLLGKVFGFRKEEKSDIITSDQDFALLYSYALVTGQLAKAMKDISSELETLFGVLDEDVRSDSIALSIPNPLTLSKTNGTPAPSSSKAQKTTNAAQRIDLEPLYTNLKLAIGDQWGNYKEAISLFILGHLNQNELSLHIDHYVCADANTEHLHNQLVAAIYGNLLRDMPDQGVAPWVSANDKPTLLSKPLAGDEAEQRLKREVMQLPARDRRRIKEVADGQVADPLEMHIARSMHDYHLARQIKLPDAVPASAGGQVKTNWDLEIRKRYLPPLASETFEFPSPADLHARMVPICYEESLPNGCHHECAEFVSTALDYYMKAVVSNIVGRVRSDLPGINSVGGGVIVTSMHANATVKEVKKKDLEARKPLGTADMRLAISVGGWGELAQMPTIVEGMMNDWNEGVLEGWVYNEFDEHQQEPEDEMERGGKRPAMRPMTNGVVTNGIDAHDEGDDEEESWGWAGGATSDRRQLGTLLDECLAIGQ
ncbi:MAG: hypothetical protein Q9224_000685 [Gallowayella concinna]